jgi:hypothetical protein
MIVTDLYDLHIPEEWNCQYAESDAKFLTVSTNLHLMMQYIVTFKDLLAVPVKITIFLVVTHCSLVLRAKISGDRIGRQNFLWNGTFLPNYRAVDTNSEKLR